MAIKILLADDSLTIQKVVELTFSDAETRLMAVGSGDRAVQALDDFQPDIVLADVVMPGLTGYDVCEAVKLRPGGAFVPVVLLTGTFEPFDRARAERVGSDAIVTKPFDSHALQGLVRDLVKKARSVREEAAAAAAAAPVPIPEPPPTMILSAAELEGEFPPPAPPAEDTGATQAMPALSLSELFPPPSAEEEPVAAFEYGSYKTMAMRLPTAEELAAAARAASESSRPARPESADSVEAPWPSPPPPPPPPPPPAFFETDVVAPPPPPPPPAYEPEPVSFAPPPPSPYYRPELVPPPVELPPPPFQETAPVASELPPPPFDVEPPVEMEPPLASFEPEPVQFVPPVPPFAPEPGPTTEPIPSHEAPELAEASSPVAAVESPFEFSSEPSAASTEGNGEVEIFVETLESVVVEAPVSPEAAFGLPADEPAPYAAELAQPAEAAVVEEDSPEPFPEMDEASPADEAAPWDEGPAVEIPPPPPELAGGEEDSEEAEPITRDLEADLEAFEASGRVRRRPEIWERHAALIGEETPADIDIQGPESKESEAPLMPEPSSSELEEMAAAARLEDLSALIPPSAAPAAVASTPVSLSEEAAREASATAVPLGRAAFALSAADIEQIARRVVELLSDKAVRDIAWEVVPEYAERLVRERIAEVERAG